MAAPTKAKKTKQAKPSDDERVIAALAYVIFFLPLIAKPDSEYAMYHANQGLLLLIAAVIINIVGWFIPILGWFLVLPIGSIVIFVLFVIGLINALNNKKEPLPIIGNYNLLGKK